MNEHLLVKVLPFDFKQTRKVNGLLDEDSLYIVDIKKVSINQRFIVYGDGWTKLVDTTIDEVLKEYHEPTDKGWVVRKQNIWEVSELSYGDKRRYMDLMKNYYPAWFNELNRHFPEDRHNSFDEYYDRFMNELNKYKNKR